MSEIERKKEIARLTGAFLAAVLVGFLAGWFVATYPWRAATGDSEPSETRSGNMGESGPDVWITPSGGKYHREGCPYLKRSDGGKKIPRAEAIRRGLKPCGKCIP